MNKILTAILTHQSPERVARMAEFWLRQQDAADVLVLYGGTRENFSRLEDANTRYVEDERLRTKNHFVEFQSYNGVFQEIARYLEAHPGVYSHVLFAEFDVLPLLPFVELAAKYHQTMEREKADAIFRLIYECQDTGQDVYLQHAEDPRFHAYWRDVSRRPDSGTVLWALVPASFWRAELILDIARVQEPYPMYFEIWLPTLAHHRGWRLRPMGDEKFKIHGGGSLDDQVAAARADGCYIIHPVKSLWD